MVARALANRLDMANSIPMLLMKNAQNLNTNIPLAWQYDSAAAPTGASALDCIETCYWDYGIDPETGVFYFVVFSVDLIHCRQGLVSHHRRRLLETCCGPYTACTFSTNTA